MIWTRRRPIAAVLVLLLVFALAWNTPLGQQLLARRPLRTFPNRTGEALVLSDGNAGVVLVDLDHRIVVRRYPDPAQAGNNGYTIVVDDSLMVVTQAIAEAVPLRGGAPTRLASGTVSVLQAVEPRGAWVFSSTGYPTSYVSIGKMNNYPVYAMTVSDVDLHGSTTLTRLAPKLPLLAPRAAIPGGVIFSSLTGLVAWDAHSGRTTTVYRSRDVSDEEVRVGRSAVSRFAWCPFVKVATSGDLRVCRDLHLTHFGDPDVVVHSPHDLDFDTRFGMLGSRFAPDARHLAVAYGARDFVTSGYLTNEVLRRSRLAVIDATRGTLVTLARTPGVPALLIWSRDSRRLYVVSEPAHGWTWISEYDIRTHRLRSSRLPIDDTVGGSAVRRVSITRLLSVRLGTRQYCGPLAEQPRPEGAPPAPCAFKF